MKLLSMQGVQKGVRFGVPTKKGLSNLGSLEKTLKILTIGLKWGRVCLDRVHRTTC